MKYQIAYLNEFGNAQLLAEEIYSALSGEDAELADIASQEVSEEADIYCICFEATRSALPLDVMELFEYLEGRTIVLFATGSAAMAKEPRRIEAHILPFLPDGSDYRGLFICPGAYPVSMLEKIREHLSIQPDDPQAKALQAGYNAAKGHPDETDKQALRRFLAQSLDI